MRFVGVFQLKLIYSTCLNLEMTVMFHRFHLTNDITRKTYNSILFIQLLSSKLNELTRNGSDRLCLTKPEIITSSFHFTHMSKKAVQGFTTLSSS